MVDITSASTKYVTQADKGKHEWYDYSADETEDVGRINLAYVHEQRPFERHRLVRRVVIDTEIDSTTSS